MTDTQIEFPLVGAAFRGADAKEAVHALVEDDVLALDPEPENQYDPNAIKVIDEKTRHFVGYVPKTHNIEVLEIIAAHPTVKVRVLFESGLKPLLETFIPEPEKTDEE